MELKERIEKFIQYKGITRSGFEKACGFSNAYIRNLKDSPSSKKIEDILNAFPEIDRVWLLTGEGSMLREEAPTPSHGKEKEILYFPNVEGTMGGVQFLDNPDETAKPIIVPGYADCQFAINAYGDSMYPLIKSGQIILLTEWTERFIDWGKIYLVITRSGYRCVKRLYPATDPSRILCKSENTEQYPPYEVEGTDILHLYLVKGWICRDII